MLKLSEYVKKCGRSSGPKIDPEDIMIRKMKIKELNILKFVKASCIHNHLVRLVGQQLALLELLGITVKHW